MKLKKLFISVVLPGIFMMLQMTGCSANDSDIVGNWESLMMSKSNLLKSHYVYAQFYPDYTGEMILVEGDNNYSTLAQSNFTWKIDGYMVVLSGQTSGEDGQIRSFNADLRFKDGKLDSEGRPFPGSTSFNSSFILTKN